LLGAIATREFAQALEQARLESVEKMEPDSENRTWVQKQST
jgi:hypothetical protein